jgi:hypothetical protein
VHLTKVLVCIRGVKRARAVVAQDPDNQILCTSNQKYIPSCKSAAPAQLQPKKFSSDRGPIAVEPVHSMLAGTCDSL